MPSRKHSRNHFLSSSKSPETNHRKNKSFGGSSPWSPFYKQQEIKREKDRENNRENNRVSIVTAKRNISGDLSSVNFTNLESINNKSKTGKKKKGKYEKLLDFVVDREKDYIESR